MTTITLYNEKASPLEIVLKAISSDVNLQPSTKYQYERAITNYAETGRSLTSPEDLQEYMGTVSPSVQSFLSATIGKLARSLEIKAKSQATPENVAEVQAFVYRSQALKESIQVEKQKGSRSHTWLSAKDVKRLIDACNYSARKNSAPNTPEYPLTARRDQMVIRLLVGAGLRRSEASVAKFSDLNQEGERWFLNVTGKGNKSRAVPLSSQLVEFIQLWQEEVGGEYILRSVGKSREIGGSLGDGAIYNLVMKRGGQIGKPGLLPHDLRRSYAQLGYKAGVDIGQVSISLGHSSIQVTQRYLGLEIDAEVAVSDFIPLG